MQQNQTQNVVNKFDSTLMDMHFKTTTSVSTQQSKGSKNVNSGQITNTMPISALNNANAMNLMGMGNGSGQLANGGSSQGNSGANGGANTNVVNAMNYMKQQQKYLANK